MHSHFNPWKTAIAVVIYVALCMLILVFSPPDYAARNAVIQNQTDVASPSVVVGQS